MATSRILTIMPDCASNNNNQRFDGFHSCKTPPQKRFTQQNVSVIGEHSVEC